MLDILISSVIAIVSSTFLAWLALSFYFRDYKKAWLVIAPTMKAVCVAIVIMASGVGLAVLIAINVSSPNIDAMIIAMITWVVYSIIWIVRFVPSKAFPVPEGEWFPKVGWLDRIFLAIYLAAILAIWLVP